MSYTMWEIRTQKSSFGKTNLLTTILNVIAMLKYKLQKLQP